jgi:hypothetical protein
MTEVCSDLVFQLAAGVRAAEAAMSAASHEMAERALEAGRLLIEAKARCRHGEWLHFLQRAGMHDRQARRLMQLTRSGLRSDTVADLGVKGALQLIANWKLPADGKVLVISTKHDAIDKFGGTAFVWESHDHPGFYHVAGVAREFNFCEATIRPASGVSPNFVFRHVARILGDRYGEMSFGVAVISRDLCEAFRRAVHDKTDAEVFAARALALIREAKITH